jgi:hypothetical protein
MSTFALTIQRRIHKECREEVLWHFITGRFWTSNGSVKSLEDGMTGEFIICFKGSERAKADPNPAR